MKLVKSCNMNDIVHLENAIAYVSGYILKRLYETVCRECIAKLEHSSSGEQPRHLTLIEQKQFKTCLHGGLKMPSFNLVKIVGLFEVGFQTHLKSLINKTKVRQTLKLKLLEGLDVTEIKGDFCNCQTVNYAVNIFISVRLHHEMKMRNEAMQQESSVSRKNRKMMKVSHQ